MLELAAGNVSGADIRFRVAGAVDGNWGANGLSVAKATDANFALDVAGQFSHLPPGSVYFLAADTIPTNARILECDGSAVSRTTYADLFGVIGEVFGTGDGSFTFNLPDLRGEFIRGWDNSRGVDSGRVFGTAQSHQLQEHQHDTRSDSATTVAAGGGTSVADDDSPITTGNVANANAGGETRPRNIALMGVIVY